MYLSKMNYREVEQYVKTSDTILIPVGSLENHGLHLPLGTDFIIPDEIARLIDRRSDLLIAPTINYGATDDLCGFAGTVSIGTEGLICLLRSICDQLYRYGFRHFLILNGHGGNTSAIQSVGMHLYRKGAYLANCNWWLMAGQLNPQWAGGHGGGDAGIMEDFSASLTESGESRSSISRSVESHLMACAIEQARLTGQVVDMEEYRRTLK